MKYIYILLILVFSLSSCSDFLSEQSEDLIIPKSVDDYNELLIGEVYTKITTSLNYLEIPTDNVSEVKGSGMSLISDNYWGYYTWQQEMEMKPDGSRLSDLAWSELYKTNMVCNIVLEEVGKLSADEQEVNYLKGEAYFLRAYSYFLLVNLYGKPYDKVNSTSDLGVPINLEPNPVDKLFSRNTVEEVYQQIESDLKASINEFEKAGIEKSIFHASKLSSYLLLSRVYLYKKDWENVISYSEKALEIKSSLLDLTNVENGFKFYSTVNSEIIFTYGGSNYVDFIPYYQSIKFFAVSNELANIYTDNDVRKSKYIKPASSRGGPGGPGGGSANLIQGKMEFSGEDLLHGAFRVSEIYLNRAEAYANTDREELALEDIKYIRQNRINNDLLSPEQTSDVFQLVKNERRRELCFEQQRWFDLRRWDQPEISHEYLILDDNRNVVANKVFKLEKNDPSYTFQLPYLVREFNQSMIINERYERTPISQN